MCLKVSFAPKGSLKLLLSVSTGSKIKNLVGPLWMWWTESLSNHLFFCLSKPFLQLNFNFTGWIRELNPADVRGQVRSVPLSIKICLRDLMLLDCGPGERQLGWTSGPERPLLLALCTTPAPNCFYRWPPGESQSKSAVRPWEEFWSGAAGVPTEGMHLWADYVTFGARRPSQFKDSIERGWQMQPSFPEF